MMEALLEGLMTGGGSFLGGILALGTSWLNHRQTMAFEQLRFQNRELELNHELQLIPLEMERGAMESEAAIELTNSQGSWAGLAASYQEAASIGGTYKWADAVRTLVRPVLTLGGVGAMIGAAYGFAGPEAQSESAAALLMTAQTASTWWFGDRAIARVRG